MHWSQIETFPGPATSRPTWLWVVPQKEHPCSGRLLRVVIF
jgi:hypothetical protein